MSKVLTSDLLAAAAVRRTARRLVASRRRASRWLRQIWLDARRVVAPAPLRPEPGQWSDQDITLAWLGHSIVLINFHGISILTDPVLGQHVGLSFGLGTVGPKRYITPALRLGQLPPIDVLLLSHGHMDHMDLPTLRGLRGATLAVTAKDTADILKRARLRAVVELAWGESTTFRCSRGELEIRAFEVKHWGQRWPSERPRGYNGYILGREGRRLIFGGDTAYTPVFTSLRSGGPFEAAIMPIAAYDPWIWNHCTPEQALDMALAAGANYIIPVHHQTFRLSQEPMDEPIQRLDQALQHEPERLALRSVGETFRLHP